MGQSHDIVHRDAADRHERQDVGRPNAWVHSAMLPQVDPARGFCDCAHGGLNDDLRFSDERNHRAIVIDIHVPPEDDGAGCRLDRLGDPIDDFDLAAFTEVWYTLNEAIFDL